MEKTEECLSSTSKLTVKVSILTQTCSLIIGNGSLFRLTDEIQNRSERNKYTFQQCESGNSSFVFLWKMERKPWNRPTTYLILMGLGTMLMKF